MAQYHLHIRLGSHVIADFEGTRFRNLAHARIYAAEVARIVLESLDPDQPLTEDKFEITDDSGRLMLVLPFCDLFGIRH